MAAVVKGLTHLAVNQTFAGSNLVSRPIKEKHDLRVIFLSDDKKKVAANLHRISFMILFF